MPVPQVPHVPLMALRPFFMVTFLVLVMVRAVLHLTQYPSPALSFFPSLRRLPFEPVRERERERDPFLEVRRLAERRRLPEVERRRLTEVERLRLVEAERRRLVEVLRLRETERLRDRAIICL